MKKLLILFEISLIRFYRDFICFDWGFINFTDERRVHIIACLLFLVAFNRYSKRFHVLTLHGTQGIIVWPGDYSCLRFDGSNISMQGLIAPFTKSLIIYFGLLLLNKLEVLIG
jgi:hypothetical protein